MGGSEVIVLLIGLVQVKFIAIFLGPAGVGLIGMYSSILNLVSKIAGLGVGGAGVKEVAKSVATGDKEKIGRTVLTLRRVCWPLGIVGSMAVVIFAEPVSQISFGTVEHAWALVLLAWIILIRNIQGAQVAYLNGLRRIGDIAKLKIIGAAGGAVIGVGFYAWGGLDGIVPALLSMALFNLFASWWYAKKIPPPSVAMTWRDSVSTSKPLVLLGLVFMWTGVLSAGVAYITRLMINLQYGVEAVGLFQAAFRLSILFVNFVLQAMGSDFLPRLTGVADDNIKVNKLVNEQTEIALLLSVPGILAVMVLAPWLISIFYTSQFAVSAELLQWFVLGCLGRVISWPMGFLLIAKGEKRWLMYTETAMSLLHLLLIWTGLQMFGLHGVAMAFFILYIVYIILMLFVSHRISGYRWDSGVTGILLKIIPITTFVFIANQLIPYKITLPMGIFITVVMGIYCLSELTKRLDPDHRLCRIMRFVPFMK